MSHLFFPLIWAGTFKQRNRKKNPARKEPTFQTLNAHQAGAAALHFSIRRATHTIIPSRAIGLVFVQLNWTRSNVWCTAIRRMFGTLTISLNPGQRAAKPATRFALMIIVLTLCYSPARTYSYFFEPFAAILLLFDYRYNIMRRRRERHLPDSFYRGYPFCTRISFLDVED